MPLEHLFDAELRYRPGMAPLADPLAAPGQPPCLSSRLHRDASRRAEAAPPVEELRRVLVALSTPSPDNAGEVAAAAVYAIRANMTVVGLAGTWAPYLTMSEALRLAAQAFRRDISRLSCCAA